MVEIGKLDPENPVSTFGNKLQGFAQGALDALAKRAAVKGANTSTGNDVEEWKEGVNSLRLLTWTELLKIADAKSYPRSWTEAFFRRVEDAGKEPAGGDPAPAPVDPQPNP